MIKQNEIIEIKAEKAVYGGFCIGYFENKTVFIKGLIPNEKARVKIISLTKNKILTEPVEILEPSNKRIKPPCPLYKHCGGCDYNFMDYNLQIELKENIIKEIFKNFSPEFKPLIKSPEILNYRHKTQYPAAETKNSKRVKLGYYKEKTHDITDIKFCPVQPSVIDKIMQFIRENWNFGCYGEKTNKGLLRHVNSRISSCKGDILLTFVLNLNEEEFKTNEEELKPFFDLITAEFPEIKGVFVNLNNKKTNKITGEKTILIKGKNFITEKLEDKIYKTGADSFFQINPKCASLLFSAARKLLEGERGTLLDLYGGLGAIGIFMKDTAGKITLVEENKEAIKLAKENFKLNNVLKYEIFEGKANDTIKKFIKEKREFKNIIIDPPRKGSDKETLQNISKMTNSIIYISCNPSTLKRDAEILINEGFDFISIQAADMFPNTHHIECIAEFKRKNWK